MAQRLPINYLLRADLANLSEEFDLTIDTRSHHQMGISGSEVLLYKVENPKQKSSPTEQMGLSNVGLRELPLPEVEGGWLERFDGIFSEDMASVDASILLGIQLASEQKA